MSRKHGRRFIREIDPTFNGAPYSPDNEANHAGLDLNFPRARDIAYATIAKSFNAEIVQDDYWILDIILLH